MNAVITLSWVYIGLCAYLGVWFAISELRKRRPGKTPLPTGRLCQLCGGANTNVRWDNHTQLQVCVERDLCRLMIEYKKLLDKV